MKEQPFLSASLGSDLPRLEAVDVTFLGNGPYSFSLDGGECLGLCGQSGVGKTQLLRALADLIPHAGRVSLNGVVVEDIPAPDWRRFVGLVPSDPCWWHDLVGPHFTESTEAESFLMALKRLGFGEEVLGWEVSRLSTGERQRLALVRALVLEPRILLLDEPTSGLDSYHVTKLEELIDEIRSSNTIGVVWVSHDSAQLERVATRVLKVEKQRLVMI